MPLNPLILTLWLCHGPLFTALQEPPAPVLESYTEKIPGSEIEITWIAIPVGQKGYPESIRIGSPEQESGRNEDEGPTWTLEVKPFWIMKCEVTWDAFDLFREQYGILQQDRVSSDKVDDETWADAVSIPTPLWEQDSRPILEGLGTGGGYPVADITQFAAMQFSKWLSRKTGKVYVYRQKRDGNMRHAAVRRPHTRSEMIPRGCPSSPGTLTTVNMTTRIWVSRDWELDTARLEPWRRTGGESMTCTAMWQNGLSTATRLRLMQQDRERPCQRRRL